MVRPLALAATLALFTVLGACGDKPEPAGGGAAAKPVIYTTFYPTTYFTQRLAGDLVTVVCPVPADEDAIFWKPDDATVARYQKADLIVVNGADFEKWVLATSLPQARVVDTAKPFAAGFVKFEKAVTHSHGPAGEHAHEGIDGHTWLDPINAKVQAGEIAKALAKLLPAHAATFEANLKALRADLDALDAGLKTVTEKLAGAPLLASHPAYNYVAKRYSWNVKNLDLDPGEMPSDEAFAAIKALLAEHPAKIILWESFPLSEIAKRFAEELGLRSVEFSPCELVDPEALAGGEDYLSVMKRNLANLM
jgi:zinc transport system substrate-binding protein